ncbi:MAG: asparagine synthetase B, partial [Candidatus Parcubacteria bacterium]|nr:asparagine synthetase B [Candidatus Parcubacteria bacterium]
MCGIAGFVGKGEKKDIEAMTRSLLRRGPDDQGIFFEKGVALGHTRLSILDLSPLGHQPMFSQDKTVGIVFNGEIYNFQKLKPQLSSDGYLFQGASDTEVILALYEKYGEKCFEKMHGMFALALYDKKNERLILARDRMGKKPLYWFFLNGTFAFASEMKSLLQHPIFKKDIDLFALNKYLLYEHIPTPQTIFKYAKKLEPGQYLVYEKGEIRKEKYWKPDFMESDISFEEALVSLDKGIDSSVKERMVSDV